jgi:hypothetical protein
MVDALGGNSAGLNHESNTRQRGQRLLVSWVFVSWAQVHVEEGRGTPARLVIMRPRLWARALTGSWIWVAKVLGL